jgi:hypothetical protein
MKEFMGVSRPYPQCYFPKSPTRSPNFLNPNIRERSKSMSDVKANLSSYTDVLFPCRPLLRSLYRRLHNQIADCTRARLRQSVCAEVHGRQRANRAALCRAAGTDDEWAARGEIDWQRPGMALALWVERFSMTEAGVMDCTVNKSRYLKDRVGMYYMPA